MGKTGFFTQRRPAQPAGPGQSPAQRPRRAAHGRAHQQPGLGRLAVAGRFPQPLRRRRDRHLARPLLSRRHRYAHLAHRIRPPQEPTPATTASSTNCAPTKSSVSRKSSRLNARSSSRKRSSSAVTTPASAPVKPRDAKSASHASSASRRQSRPAARALNSPPHAAATSSLLPTASALVTPTAVAPAEALQSCKSINSTCFAASASPWSAPTALANQPCYRQLPGSLLQPAATCAAAPP